VKKRFSLVLGALLLNAASAFSGTVAGMSGTVFTSQSQTETSQAGHDGLLLSLSGAALLAGGLIGRKHGSASVRE